jgi:hypothetical protein
VPNSQSDYATSDGSGPESEFDCHVTKFRFSYHVTCRLSVLQAVLVYWSAGFCQIYSLKCYSRNYSEMCAKFMQILRQMLHFLQFLCMQIDACHLSKGIITSSFISLNIIYFGLCFQHLRSCPALYFVMDPYFGIKLNLLLDLWDVVLSSIHISMRFLVIIITQSTEKYGAELFVTYLYWPIKRIPVPIGKRIVGRFRTLYGLAITRRASTSFQTGIN